MLFVQIAFDAALGRFLKLVFIDLETGQLAVGWQFLVQLGNAELDVVASICECHMLGVNLLQVGMDEGNEFVIA